MRVLAENMEAADPQQRRLREFAAALAEKLRATPSADQAPARLAVRIGEDRYLLDMAVAGEIVAVLNVNAGLLITRAFGLRNLKDLRALDSPPADAAMPWLGRRFAEADGSVLAELDLARLVASELFTAIGV